MQIRKQMISGKVVYGHGFTLVELIVSMALFTTVMFMSVSLLLAASNMSEQVRSLRIAADNLNVVLEGALREARYGSDFYVCDSSGLSWNYCPTYPVTATDLDTFLSTLPNMTWGNGDTFMFVADNGDVVIYRGVSSNSTIEKSTDGGATFFEVVSSDTNIQRVRFTQKGFKYNTFEFQPRVIIEININVNGRVSAPLFMQTAITQRKVVS